MRLPGVSLVALTPHSDERGVFTELFRESWGTGFAGAQWNAVSSGPNVLRGVHVHRRHVDYLTLVAGRATIGFTISGRSPRLVGTGRRSSSTRASHRHS